MTWMRAIPAILLLAISAAPSADDAAPLRVEDVVRQFVGGASESELLERIRSGPVEFSLDDEMVGELEIAGIPRSLIDAMLARQRAEWAAATPGPPGAADGAADVPADDDNVVLRIDSGGKRGGEIRLSVRIDAPVAEALGLRPDQQTFDDLALFVVCRSATHVPDRWRTVSPLGRDFKGTVRHRMLHFEAGAVEERGQLRLALPETLALRLDAGIDHRLAVGVAAGVGGSYFSLQSIDLPDVVPGDDGDGVVEVVVRVRNTDRSGHPASIELKRLSGDAGDATGAGSTSASTRPALPS